MEDSSNMADVLEEVIRRDDQSHLIFLLSENPELLDDAAKTWPNNPLLVACEQESVHVAEEIIRRKPEFANRKYQNGLTVMDVAAEKGLVSMVEKLVKIDPLLCLEVNSSMIPLHRAVVKGHFEVVRVLASSCPVSIRKVTFQDDTAILLAAKHFRSDIFEFLMEEAKKHNQEQILNWKDDQGNTVLHIAVQRSIIPIVKLLLPQQNSTSPRVVRVNTMNKTGDTPMDVFYKLSYLDTASLEIGEILRNSGAVERKLHGQQAIPAEQSQNPMAAKRPVCHRNSKWVMQTRNVLLVVIVMIAGGTFTMTCNVPAAFLAEKFNPGATFHVKDVIFGRLPSIFYVIVFDTTAFTMSMGTVIVLIWSLPFSTVLLFLVVTFFITYVLVANETAPRFSLRVGSRKIASSALLWLLALAVIFIGGTILSLLHKLINRLKSKSSSDFARMNVDTVDCV